MAKSDLWFKYLKNNHDQRVALIRTLLLNTEKEQFNLKITQDEFDQYYKTNKVGARYLMLEGQKRAYRDAVHWFVRTSNDIDEAISD